MSTLMPLNNRQLAEELCGVSAGVREIHRVHEKSYGTLIPHVFMASVLSHIGVCLAADQRRDARLHTDEVAGILGSLEQGMARGDRETRNVISISFARDSELEPFFYQLYPLLGPKLKRELRGS
jgi:hypothetical protein